MNKALIIMLIASTLAFTQTLTVTEGTNNHAASNESGSGSDIQMLQMQLSADAVENIVVTSLKLTPTSSGFRNDEVIGPDIHIYHDKNDNGILETEIDELITTANYSGSSWNAPGTVTISIPDKVIFAGTSQNWIILNTFSGGDNNDYLEIQVAANGDIVAEGQTSASSATISGAPVSGNRKTVTTTASAGNLFVATSSLNPIDRNINDGADDEVMMQLTLSASTLENIDVSQVSLDMSGSGDESLDLSIVRLYDDIDNDGNINKQMDIELGTAITSFSNDGSLVFSGLAETITAGEYANWIVVYDYDGSETSAGEAFDVTLTNNSDITATGVSSALSSTISGASVAGGLATISSTGTLFVTEGVDNPAGKNIQSSGSGLEFFQINLSAGQTEAVDISSITFTTSGTADESTDIDSVKLFLDVDDNGVFNDQIDSQIGNTASSFTNNGTVVFSSLSEQISASGSENWLLVYYLNGSASANETFQIYLNQTSDISATGATSSSSISASGVPAYGNYMTVSTIGALSLSLGANNPADENINGGSSNVTMMQLKLEASAAEDIQINSIYFTTSGSGFRVDEVVNPDIRIYRDVNNNGIYDSGTDQVITTQSYSGSSWNFPGNTTVTFTNEVIYAGSSQNWLVINNFSGGDVNDNLQLTIVNNSDVSTTGLTSSGTVNVTGASLSGSKKTVVSTATAGTLILSSGGNDPGYQNITSGASNEVMLDLQLSASSEDIQISEIRFSTSGSGNESSDLDSVRIFEDTNNDGKVNQLDYDRQIGSTISSFTDDGDLIFTGISETITDGDTENWLVLYDFDGAQTSNGETFQITLEGNASVIDSGLTSNEAATTTGAPILGGIGTISQTGSLTQGSSNPDAHNISAAESELVMLQLNLASSETEAIDVSAISFTSTGSANESTDIDSVKLFLDDNDNGTYESGSDSQIGSTITSFTDNGLITFSSLSEQITSSSSENWIVVYYLNGLASSTETFRLYVADNTDLSASGNVSLNTVIPVGAPVHGNEMTVSNVGDLTIALGDNNPGDENISGGASNVTMLQLKMSASSTEDLQINSLYFTTSGSGIRIDEVVNPDMRVYRDVNNNGVYESGTDELITTQSYVGSSWNFPGNTTITFTDVYLYAGTTENWLFVNNFSGGDTDDNIELSIVNNSNVSVTGVTSASAANVSGATLDAGVKTVVSGSTAGSLTMAVGQSDPGYHNVADGASDEIMFDVQFTAGSENVEISKVTFDMSGTGNESTDLDSVRLYEDVNDDGKINLLDYDRQIGATLTSFTDDGSLVFSGLSEVIDANNFENWLVLYDFNGAQTTLGETYQVGISANGAVVDTGQTSGEAITNSGAPITSGVGTISNVGSLTLSAGADNPASKNIGSAETNLVMTQLNLSASSTEAVDISAITFTMAGSGDESTDITSAGLYKDVNNNATYDNGIDTQIGSTISSFTNDGTLVFGSLSEQISAAGDENWLVVYTLNGNATAGEGFRAYLANNNDVTAVGATSSSSITPSGAAVHGNTMTVSATGALTIALGDNNPGDENISGGASNVTMLQLKMSASSTEDLQINSLYFTTSGSGIRNDEVVNPDLRVYRDVNNNGVYESGTDELITTQSYVGSSWNFPGNTTITFTDVYLYAGTTENWLFVNNFSGGDTDDNIELSIVNNSNVSVTGVTSASAANVSGATLDAGVKTVVSGSTAGSLTLSLGGNDPGYRNISSGADDEVMFQLLLSAGSNESIQISDISFDMSGSGNESTDLDSVRIFEDVDGNGQINLLMDSKIGSTITSFTDNGQLQFSGLSEVVSAGTSENWIIIYDFNNAQTSDGETFKLSLPSNGSIVDTGITSGLAITNSGAPVESGLATISSTGNLTLSEGDNNPVAHTIAADVQNLSMLQMKLTANATEDIRVTSVTFNSSGTANESTDIDSVKLFHDVNSNAVYDAAFDVQIGSTLNSFTDNGQLLFSGISDTLYADNSENWLIIYYLNGNATAGETFRSELNNSTSITATGITSTNSISPSGTPVSGNAKTVSDIGTLTMTLASANPGTENINGNADNVSMMAMTLSANNVEDISISSLTISTSSSGFRIDEIENTDIKIYEDVNNNGIYDSATDRFITSANYSGSSWNAPSNRTLSISGETIAAGASVDWLVLHSFQGGDVDDYLEISVVQNSDISATGVNSSSAANISGASISGGRKTVVNGSTPGTLTISAGAQNPAYRYISKGAQNEVMNQLQLNSSPVEDITLTSLKFVTSGSGDESADIDSVRLFIDGDDDGSLNLLNDTQIGTTLTSLTNNDTLEFSGISETINSGSMENWIVVYNMLSSANTANETFQVDLSGNGAIIASGVTSGQSITADGAPVDGGTAVISDNGTLTISAGTNNPQNGNITNSETDLTSLQISVTAGPNEDITVTSVSMDLSGTFNDTLDFAAHGFCIFKDDNNNGILDGSETQIGGVESCTDDNGTVTFNGFSETILASTTQNWIVVTNLSGSASQNENFRVTLSSSVDVTATGETTGNPIYPTGAPVQGGLFTVSSTGSLNLALGSNNPSAGSELTSAQELEMLQMTLSASSVENINVASITFTADGTADDLADLNGTNNGVSLYIDVDNDGILDGGDTQIDVERTFSANDGTLTFTTTGEVINAGQSENWLLVYDLDGSASVSETFRVGFYNPTDISATGATSSQSITPGGAPVVGNYKTIATSGSMALFEGQNNPSTNSFDTVDILDYEMMQFRLTASSIEGIDVTGLTITHQGSGNPATDVVTNGVQLVRDVNNNGVYDSGTDNILTSTSFSGTTATFSLSGITVPVDSSENWIIMYDFSGSLVTGDTYQARLVNLTDISIDGATSANSITPSGSVPLAGGTMTASGDFSLPVELTSFEAKGDYGFIELNWITASEINNLGFTLERKRANDSLFTEISSFRLSEDLQGQGTVSYQTDYIFKDSTVVPGQEYAYRLLQHDLGGQLTVETIIPSAIAKEALPKTFQLSQNYPNPFNPETTIKIGLPEQSDLKLVIYNILGQKVKTLKNKIMDAGFYKVTWDGQNDLGNKIGSGQYFYVLHVKGKVTQRTSQITKKMLLIR
ncbi:MAG: T9SS C-terminal target domain-containing protein [Calditrichaeota bacterium]|nr:MAG: T9SS C-terminal target domain-containing protein [Calditrichota bacterium]